jgi:hypothetical protein
LTAPILNTSTPNRSKQSLHYHFMELNKDFKHYLQERRPKLDNIDRVLLFREFCERIAPLNIIIFLCGTLLCLTIFFVLVGLYMENVIPDRGYFWLLVWAPMAFIVFAIVPCCIVVSYCTIGTFPYIGMLCSLICACSKHERLMRTIFYNDISSSARIMLTVLSFAIDLLWIPTLILCVGFKMAFYRQNNVWSYAVLPVYPAMVWGLVDFIYRFISGFEVSFKRPRKLTLALFLISLVATVFSMWATSVALFAAWGDMLLMDVDAALLLTPGFLSIVLLLIVMSSPFCYKIIQSKNAGRRTDLRIAIFALLLLVLAIVPVLLFVILLVVRLDVGGIPYYWIFSPLYFELFALLVLCTGSCIVYKYF